MQHLCTGVNQPEPKGDTRVRVCTQRVTLSCYTQRHSVLPQHRDSKAGSWVANEDRQQMKTGMC